MEGKIIATFAFIKFFFNLFGLGKLLLFLQNNIIFTGHAPLIIKIFNNKSDIILLISCFFSLKRFYLEFYC